MKSEQEEGEVYSGMIAKREWELEAILLKVASFKYSEYSENQLPNHVLKSFNLLPF